MVAPRKILRAFATVFEFGNFLLILFYNKPFQMTEECGLGGSPRRCGGQGDVLSGSLATFLHWASLLGDSCPPPGAEVIAAWGSSRLTRGCAEQAFNTFGRSLTTTDIINVIHQEFSRLYENETFL